MNKHLREDGLLTGITKIAVCTAVFVFTLFVIGDVMSADYEQKMSGNWPAIELSPVIGISPCELQVSKNQTLTRPCVAITDPSEFIDASVKYYLDNNCHDLSSIVNSIAKNNACPLTEDKNVHAVLFQYGGEKNSANDGMPSHDNQISLDGLHGYLEMKSQAKGDGYNPVSAPVIIDSKNKTIGFFGYRALWDKPDIAHQVGWPLLSSHDNCLGDPNSNGACYADVFSNDHNWMNLLLEDETNNYYDSNVVKSTNWTEKRATTILLTPAPQRMQIRIDLDTDTEYAFTVNAGHVIFRDLNFILKKGRLIKVAAGATVEFIRCKLTVEGGDEGAKTAGEVVSNEGDGLIDYCEDYSCGTSSGLELEYVGDDNYKGFVKWNKWSTKNETKTFLEKFFDQASVVFNAKVDPINFGTTQHVCAEQDGDCVLENDLTCETPNCSEIEVYRLRNTDGFYKLSAASFEAIQIGNAFEYHFEEINKTLYHVAIVLKQHKEGDRYILSYKPNLVEKGYRQVYVNAQEFGCKGTVNTVKGYKICGNLCADGFTPDESGKCICNGGTLGGECREGVDNATIGSDGSWACNEGYKLSDGVCALDCGSDKTLSADGKSCECPSDQPLNYDGMCVASKDDIKCPYAEQVVTGEIKVTCECPAGKFLDVEQFKCVENPPCSLTQDQCASGYTLVTDANGVCKCQFGSSDCPTGQHKDNGACVADGSCPTGQHMESGNCVNDVAETACASGEVLTDGVCTKVATECADGEELDDDGVCVTISTSCGEDETWDVLEEKCVELSVADDADDGDDSDDDGGGGCSMKKKADGTYGCSLATASASGGGMYVYLLLLGYFVTARLRKK